MCCARVGLIEFTVSEAALYFCSLRAVYQSCLILVITLLKYEIFHGSDSLLVFSCCSPQIDLFYHTNPDVILNVR